ncbi:MAG: hypothetical protein QGI24_10310 [Kiritimatiellia bacterium]|jgi:hypothetical protein|nr:hypothetical protein [Kiritimatiellia bacterium]MDP6849166.1 hypothetical protein [Kiritimatiellia bacterium]
MAQRTPQTGRQPASFGLRAIAALAAIALLGLASGCATRLPGSFSIDNPYGRVNWQEDGRYKASLHTHTKASDGAMYPHEVIDRYKALDYDILAITDHDHVSYPWTGLSKLYGKKYENRDPDEVGMLDIPGNELSKHHHMGSYWTRYKGKRKEVWSLISTRLRGGQVMMNHPGRYGKKASWYVKLFKRFDHLTGIEVYNQGDRYSGDRKKWDEILTLIMPHRPVWGYSNDDMHKLPHLGRNWNVFVLPRLSDRWIRKGMKDGLFYFVYAPKGHKGAKPPEIESIKVDEKRMTIRINATGCKSIEWIADGKVVASGPELNMGTTMGINHYVRAVLHGPKDGTLAGTQPFGIRGLPSPETPVSQN